MSVRAVLDAAYALRARNADETDRLSVLTIAAAGGDVSSYEHARTQLDRDLGFIEDEGLLPGLVPVSAPMSLTDLARSKGWVA